MAINTIEFLVFAMAVCAIYFVVPKKVKWIVLLLASYIYYFIASGRLTIFLPPHYAERHHCTDSCHHRICRDFWPAHASGFGRLCPLVCIE